MQQLQKIPPPAVRARSLRFVSCSRRDQIMDDLRSRGNGPFRGNGFLDFFLKKIKKILRISVGQTLWKCLFLTVKSRESTSKSVKIFAPGGRYPSETTVRGHQTDQTIDTGLVLLVNLYLYEWYNMYIYTTQLASVNNSSEF